MNIKSIPLDIQRSLLTACNITITHYYPQRNKSAAARAYVKQSIEAIRFLQMNTSAEDWIAVML